MCNVNRHQLSPLCLCGQGMRGMMVAGPVVLPGAGPGLGQVRLSGLTGHPSLAWTSRLETSGKPS